MSKSFEQLIKTLLEKGFNFSGIHLMESGEIAFDLEGFYKSGIISLYEDSNYIYALARYKEITILNDDGTNPFKNLVHLNYEWWQRSRNRLEGWKQPDSKWLPFLIDEKLVEVEVKTITVVK